MTGDIKDIVNPSRDPVVAVFIAARAVAREVAAFEFREICLEKTLVIAIDCAHLARPAVSDDQIAGRGAIERVAVAVDDRGHDSGQRLGR